MLIYRYFINPFSTESSKPNTREVSKLIYTVIGFIPKMFMEQTGEAKEKELRDKMKAGLLIDNLKLLKETVIEAEMIQET